MFVGGGASPKRFSSHSLWYWTLQPLVCGSCFALRKPSTAISKISTSLPSDRRGEWHPSCLLNRRDWTLGWVAEMCYLSRRPKQVQLTIGWFF